MHPKGGSLKCRGLGRLLQSVTKSHEFMQFVSQYEERKSMPTALAATMPFPAAETISANAFPTVLDRVEHLLANLPGFLIECDPAISKYRSFHNFAVDPDLLEDTGDEVATFGEQLERIFGWKARTSGDGVLPIEERGSSICAIVPIFRPSILAFRKTMYSKNGLLMLY